MNIRLKLSLLILLFTPICALAQGGPESESLKGIQRVRVLVAATDPEIAGRGLATSTLKTDIELRLRKEGINVVDKSLNTLYFDLGYIEHTKLYAFSFDMEFWQFVSLPRDPTTNIVATTWASHKLVMVGEDNIGQMRLKLSDMLDRFINDYLAANPKK